MEQSESRKSADSGYFVGILAGACVQLFCGVANLAVGIANAVICGFLGPVGYGIWGAVLCFIGGSTGLVAAIGRSRSMIVTHMVFSIIVAVSACVQLGMGAGSAVVDYQTHKKEGGDWSIYPGSGVYDYRHSSAYSAFDYFGCSDKQRSSYSTRANGPTVTDALLASFAIIQGVIAILGAVFSCKSTVCPPGVDRMPWESEYGSEGHFTRKA